MIRIKKPFLLVAACCLAMSIGIPLCATETATTVVTLQEALQASRQNNIDLSIAQIKLQQALRTQNATASTFMPSISLTGGLSTGGSVISGTYSGINMNVSAGASFSFDGSMLTDSQTRALNKEDASLTYQSTFSSLQESVITAYWNLAANENAVEEAQLSLGQAKQQLQTAQDQYENGTAPNLTVVQAQLSVSKAEIQLKQLQDSKTLAMSAFKALTGIELEAFAVEDLPQTVELALPASRQLYEQYGEDTTTIKALRNALAQAQNDSKTTTLANRVPTVSVSTSWTLSETAAATTQTTNGLNDTASLSLSVSVPLSSYINGTTANLQIKDSQDAVTTAQLQLQAGRQTLLQSIDSAVTSITQQQENIMMQAQNVETSQYSYELSQQAFEAGLLSAQELEEARTELLNAQVTLLNTKLSQLLSCYDLASLLGIDLATLQTQYSASV